ncbi:PadR family transcriptional regulator [Microbacterium sp.]|uniref:PadR family transcriptional regulator n=1 Tax=Microbacterium sp. TaxID=51671 RepID=UPI003C77E049
MPKPLTPAVFHILVALADGDLHGYAIMKRVETDSDGALTMGPGTLYGALNRMMDAGLVRETGVQDVADQRRIHYTLTDAGRVALSVEVARLRQAVALTRSIPARTVPRAT